MHDEALRLAKLYARAIDACRDKDEMIAMIYDDLYDNAEYIDSFTGKHLLQNEKECKDIIALTVDAIVYHLETKYYRLLNELYLEQAKLPKYEK